MQVIREVDGAALIDLAQHFIGSIDDRFDNEHGITLEEAVIGTASTLRKLGIQITSNVHEYECDEQHAEYYERGYCPHRTGPGKPASAATVWYTIVDGPVPPLSERYCTRCRDIDERIVIVADGNSGQA